MPVKDLTPQRSPPFSPNLLLHPDSFPGTKMWAGWFSGFYCGCISGVRIGRRAGPPRRGQRRPADQRGRSGGEDTSLFSDLQFPRHLAEAAGQTEGEGRPVVPDGALEVGESG